MRVKINNVGKVKNADIEINGITVVAGENVTGKSTISKSLYALFRTLYNKDEKIESQRLSFISNQLLFLYTNSEQNSLKPSLLEILAKEIFSLTNQDKITEGDLVKDVKSKLYELIKSVDHDFNLPIDDANFISFCHVIDKIVHLTDLSILKTILDFNLSSEFNNQINNIYTSELGEISLKIKTREIHSKICNNKVSELENSITLLLEPVYIDNTIVLEDLFSSYTKSRFAVRNDHHSVLRSQLERNIVNEYDGQLAEQKIVNEELSDIFEYLSQSCSGEMVLEKGELFYKLPSSNKLLAASNLSAGLKTFAIIKTLLRNGLIKRNGLIILDEPENHLHPKWQIALAKIIVLLHKKFNLHVLLNTHSPYFLQAIQVESASVSIADKCKYYLASNIDEFSVVEDVTNNVEKIYALLAQPFQDLEDIKAKNNV